MSQIAEIVARGEISENASKVVYLRERREGDGPKDIAFTKVEARLERVGMMMTLTQEMVEDRPAMKAFVGSGIFARSLGGIVVDAIEREDVKRFRPRIWETNKRAIARARAEVEHDGGFSVVAVPFDRSKTVVGAFAEGVTLWTQGDVSTEMLGGTDSFVGDLIAVRFEQPAVVTVYRPQSFGIVRTRDWRRLRKLFRR
jgi:hypothetical protein